MFVPLNVKTPHTRPNSTYYIAIWFVFFWYSDMLSSRSFVVLN